MSLINKMLQDLDARRAAHGVGANLPNDVRPLPVQSRSFSPWLLGVIILLLLAGVAAYLVVHRQDASAPAVSPPVQAELPGPVETVVPPGVLPALPVADTKPSPSESRPTGADGLRLADALAASPGKSGDARIRAAIKKESGKSLPAERALPERRDTEAGASSNAAGGKVQVDEDRGGRAALIEKNDADMRPRDRAESGYRKALAVVNQGRVDEALETLYEVLRTDGLHVASRQLVVKLLLEARRVDEVMRVLQEGLQGQPTQIGWAMSLARLQVDRGDLVAASETLQHSLPAAASNPDYQGFSAHILQRLGRNREAAELYRAAARLTPADGRWWLGLGLALEVDGHADQALAAFQQARQSSNLNRDLMALIEQKLQR